MTARVIDFNSVLEDRDENVQSIRETIDDYFVSGEHKFALKDYVESEYENVIIDIHTLDLTRNDDGTLNVHVSFSYIIGE